MKRLFKELRRREVFRTAGLYVGICWILIEVGSVMLPAFDAPDWLFRGAIVAAIAGFPIMLILAWFLDVNADGISLQGDPTDSAAQQLGARKSDFAIIGLLALALAVSLFLNVKNDTPSESEAKLAPLTVLVADFAGTGDEPLFEHVLEHALTVGVEVAPHVTTFTRRDALTSERAMNVDAVRLNRELAALVAQREGINILLAGSVQAAGNSYRIAVEGIDVLNQQTLFTIEEKAASRDAVLAALGKLSVEVRAQLGDRSADAQKDGPAQTFIATSLQAAQAYVEAMQLEMSGKLQDAAKLYEQASTEDANSGRIFARLALVEFALGQSEEAAAHWSTAMSLANTLTERERLHLQARYQALVVKDGDAAADVYSELVEKYPGDVAARERFARLLAQQRDFESAAQQMADILQRLPADLRHRTTLAVYALYQGDWELAGNAAEMVISADPNYGTAYYPIAMAAMVSGDVETATSAYQQMAAATTQGASIAELGMADIEFYGGEFAAAQKRLLASIDAASNNGEQDIAAQMAIALAESYLAQGNIQAAVTAATQALSLSDATATTVSAGLIYFAADDGKSASAIAERLSEHVDAESRAYALMLQGMLLEREGSQTEAILAMRRAISMTDSWLIRFQVGKAYLRAGNYTEALDELTTLTLRQGEATAVFLNGMPTYRVFSELPYWRGRVQEGLSMVDAARESYAEFVALRPEGGALAGDANERVAGLE